MLIRVLVISMLFLHVFAQDINPDQKSSAELLLEALGEQNNQVDSDLGQLLHNFISSKEKSSVTAAQFFSTFLQSLTKESLVILLVAPAVLAILSLVFASFSFPTLLLRGLADWTERYLARERQELALEATSLSYEQGEMAGLDSQSPRLMF